MIEEATIFLVTFTLTLSFLAFLFEMKYYINHD